MGRKRIDLAAMDEFERAQFFEELAWKKAKATKHVGLTAADYAPKAERVSVHDFEDDPSEEERDEARVLADEARAVWRSQFRK